MKPIFIYLITINLVAFIAYGLDKWFAQNNKWRISERTLLGLTLIGGTVGGFLAMLLFRHKIKKAAFLIPFVIIVLLQVAAWYFKVLPLNFLY